MKLQTKQEFELYAMLYVAGLDMKISKQETKLLHENVSPELFEHVSEMFQEDSDAEAIKTIQQASAIYLSTDEQKRAFIQKLRDLAAVDNVVHVEAANLSMLEKMILTA